MFTGIITDVGRVAAREELPMGLRLRVESGYDPAGIDIGAAVIGLLATA